MGREGEFQGGLGRAQDAGKVGMSLGGTGLHPFPFSIFAYASKRANVSKRYR